MIYSSLLFCAAMVQTGMSATLNAMTTVTSSGGALSVTLDVDKFFFDDANTGVKFWTRVYNRASISGDTLHPGPILRFKRGDNVTLVLNNNLGPETGSYTDLNSFHYYNTTNMHTHGLHVSAESPQDNVLMTVAPQASHTYEYDIPDDHAGGTFWYHAHHHGSTAAQVSGGMLGAIIVEDDPTEVPEAIYNMPEVVLLMSHTPVGDMLSRYTSVSGDALGTSPDNVYTARDEFVLVNGQYQPTGSITQGEWNRLRLIFSALTSAIELKMTTNTAGCEWHLLAKDGIYVESAPRSFGDTVYMGPGNRVDVVMRCSSSGTVVLGTSGATNRAVDQENIVTLTVASSTATADPDLPKFTPYRPDYLADLYDAGATTVSFSLNIGGGGGTCTLNDQSWSGTNTSLGSMEVGTIQEWTVNGVNGHPFHLHVNSFQLKGVTDSSGFFAAGDWHDVMYAPTGVSIEKYMFAVDKFVTKSVIHCHFLPHEDTGCMGFVQHTGSHGDSTGLTGHAMSCLGTSTGSDSYNSNCAIVASSSDDDSGNDDFCFHVSTKIDYKGVEYTYEELLDGKEPECAVPHSPRSRGVIITTSCDKTVRVTDTHLLSTTKGFQLAYSLKAGDVLFDSYDNKDMCVVKHVEKEQSVQQYFGLNCVHSEVLASGLRASTFGDFHTLPSWYMTYVGGLIGSDTASRLGDYIADFYFK